jgi:hypothetical protein
MTAMLLLVVLGAIALGVDVGAVTTWLRSRWKLR